MAQTLDSLVVRFTGDASGLMRASRIGLRSVQRMGTGVVRVGRQLATFSAVAVAGVTAGLIAMGNSARNTIDELRKLAANAGLRAADIQQLQLVADLTGTSLETLQKSVQNVTRAAGDAARGLAAPRDAFEDLGLDIEELGRITAQQRFALVIEALSRLEDGTRRASIAATLLGRGWRETNVLIESGGAALRRAQTVVEGLGLGLDQSDTSVEDFNDNLAELGFIARGLLLKTFEALGPVLRRVTDRIVELTRSFILARGGGERLGEEFAATLIRGFAEFANVVVRVVDGLMMIASTVDTVIGGWRSLFEVVRPIVEFVQRAFVGFGERLGFLAAFVGQLAQGNFSGALAIDQQARQQFTPDDQTQEEQLNEQQRQTRLLEEQNTILTGAFRLGANAPARFAP